MRGPARSAPGNPSSCLPPGAGLGFRVELLRIRRRGFVRFLGFKAFSVQGLGFIGFSVQGLGFRVQCSGFRV